MNVNFWQNKKVLVTGHTGFKGGWLCLWLQKMGAEVSGYSLKPPNTTNLFQAANIGACMNNIFADIRNYEVLNKTLKELQPEIIFHLAAQPLVRHSYDFPVDTYSTNVLGTVHILDIAKNIDSCKAIINVTSDKCYENQELQIGYKENSPLGGFDPYSNSKACSEMVTRAYFNSFYKKSASKGLASARAGNVIGGGDWAQDRLIPDIIKGILANDIISIRYPNARRPWQHVLEPLYGYLELAQALYNDDKSFSGPWNFGPDINDVKPVSFIVDTMLEFANSKTQWQCNNPNPDMHETTYLYLDSFKAREFLNWKPRWDLTSALKHTFEWYEAFKAEKNMQEITSEQIDKYIY